MSRRYALTIPARVNVLGNPADANEGDYATISAAIEIRAGAFIEEAEHLTLESLARAPDGGWHTQERLTLGAPPLQYDGHLDLVKGAFNLLYEYSPEFREKFAQKKLKISTWTDVPRQSGLGGSSLFVLLALGGLRLFYDLDRRRHNDYLISEMAQRVESRELGITCGFADRYVPLFGGIAYLDYRGKLYHKPIGEEPYATYERLDDYVDEFPLIIAYTGVIRESGDVHGAMRPRYLEEYARYREGAEIPFFVRLMAEIGSTAWRGKIALLEGDWETFGALMNENHRLVNQMMEYCGFREGAGWANNLLIETALAHGALGAKLTGAGGGGSVFALARPGQEDKLVEALRQTAQENGLTDAKIFKCEIARRGLTVQTLA